MRTLLTITTKSARRKIGLTLFVVLAALGARAYAVYGASKAPLSVSPGSQEVVYGLAQSASYTVSVDPKGPYGLKISGAPQGAAVTWTSSSGPPLPPSLNCDGCYSMPPKATSATFVVRTSATTPWGTYPLTVTGTGVGGGATASATLIVQRRASSASPATSAPRSHRGPHSRLTCCSPTRTTPNCA